jgi:hypothetical protein
VSSILGPRFRAHSSPSCGASASGENVRERRVPTMNGITRSVTVLLILVVIAGCGSGTPTPITTPAPTVAIAAKSPTPTPDASVPYPVQASGTFAKIGSFDRPMGFSAVLLGDGRLLLAGGLTCQGARPPCQMSTLASIFDPETGISTPTGSLPVAEAGGSAIRLGDGRVLIAGGLGACDATQCVPIDEIQIYDPTSGTWTDGGRLPMPWTAALAVDAGDRIYFAGGTTHWELGKSTEGVRAIVSYDLGTGESTTVGSLPTAEVLGGAFFLGDGRVLLIGSDGISGVGTKDYPPLTYDPKTQRVTQGRSFFSTGTSGYSTTLMRDGKLLIVGGYQIGNRGSYCLQDAQLFDPATGSLKSAGHTNHGICTPVVISLADGRVLIAGGGGVLKTAEIYDPMTGIFSDTGEIVGPDPSMGFLLPDGRVLLISTDLASGASDVQVYQP